MKLPLLGILAACLLLAGCAQNPPSAPTQLPSPQQQVQEAANNSTPQEQAGQANESAIPQNATQANESPLQNSTQMKRGLNDTDFIVVSYQPGKALEGTTIFPDNHVAGRPRVVEVNMLGEIIWEFILPDGWKAYTNPGFDVEPLSNGNILLTLPGKGVYEIDRNGTTVWAYADPKVSHDADRLANGNTLIAFGNNDLPDDYQAKEVFPNGTVAWRWSAKGDFLKYPYKGINNEGWTHANSVSRLDNGNTLVSLRNFNLLAEVTPEGKLARTIESAEFDAQHDPAMQPNGTILMANHGRPNEAIEVDQNGIVLWRFEISDRRAWPVRDANRLANGNALVTGADRIVEVTDQGEVVWALRLAKANFTEKTA